jgi:hypothetical protein
VKSISISRSIKTVPESYRRVGLSGRISANGDAIEISSAEILSDLWLIASLMPPVSLTQPRLSIMPKSPARNHSPEKGRGTRMDNRAELQFVQT